MLAVTVRPIRSALALGTVLACIGSVCLPAVASAELSSGGGLVEMATKAEQEETSSTATTPANGKQESESTSSAIPSSVLIPALVAGVLLLGGIAFVIVRDARSVAPVVEGGVSGSSRDPQAQLRKRRAKAKAARQSRKRNSKRSR